MTQALQNRGVSFGAAMRYRALGQVRWHAAEAVQINGRELVFLCEAPFELHVEVEVLLPTKVQVMGREALLTLLGTGQVVRRVLANWPDLRSALVVSIAKFRIPREGDFLGGAAVVSDHQGNGDN